MKLAIASSTTAGWSRCGECRQSASATARSGRRLFCDRLELRHRPVLAIRVSTTNTDDAQLEAIAKQTAGPIELLRLGRLRHSRTATSPPSCSSDGQLHRALEEGPRAIWNGRFEAQSLAREIRIHPLRRS